MVVGKHTEYRSWDIALSGLQELNTEGKGFEYARRQPMKGNSASYPQENSTLPDYPYLPARRGAGTCEASSADR